MDMLSAKLSYNDLLAAIETEVSTPKLEKFVVVSVHVLPVRVPKAPAAGSHKH